MGKQKAFFRGAGTNRGATKEVTCWVSDNDDRRLVTPCGAYLKPLPLPPLNPTPLPPSPAPLPPPLAPLPSCAGYDAHTHALQGGPHAAGAGGQAGQQASTGQHALHGRGGCSSFRV